MVLAMNDLKLNLDNAAILSSLGGEIEEVTPPSLLEEPDITDKSNHYTPGQTSSTEEKAMILLGKGIGSEPVAAALGVTPSRISQLLSQEGFAQKVADLRYQNLQKHNERDGQYDKIEDKLLSKLDKAIPLLIKPESILKAITVVNSAKRRGQDSPDVATTNKNIVNLILPTNIAEKFTIDINNQVTRAGEQELLTMPSGNLLDRVEKAANQRLENKSEELQNE